MILVDTNVLIDVLQDDPVWAEWSTARLAGFVGGRVHINPVVYAELAPLFESPDALDHCLSSLRIAIEDMPKAALFLAGKAHHAYRRRGGSRDRVLSDFFIGAHAVVSKAPLLTRDAKRYRRDFPSVVLITP